MALCGTAIFGASLSHLTPSPDLYGNPFQINFNQVSGVTSSTLVEALEHDPAVAAVTRGVGSEVTIDRQSVGAMVATALKGRPLFSIVSGHLPTGDGQVALGAATMRQVGAHVGSIVHVTVPSPSGGKRTGLFRVVAQISLPVLNGIAGLGSGAQFDLTGFDDVVCPPGKGRATCDQQILATDDGGMLASFVPGARGRDAIGHYVDTYRNLAVLPTTPTSLVNFGEAVQFPLIFGLMLGLFGVATLLHLLVVSVARRRREIGLLKVLGFVNRQVGAAVAWQASTFAVVGIVIGVPLGVAIGQQVWKAFATNLGVVPVAVVPIGLVVELAAGVVIVANLLAIAPALAATRFGPAQLLRER